MRSPCISPDFREGEPGDPNPARTGLRKGREEGSGPRWDPGNRGWQSKVQVPGAAERGQGLPPPGASEKREKTSEKREESPRSRNQGFAPKVVTKWEVAAFGVKHTWNGHGKLQPCE